MGSERPNPKRQRLASLSATPSAASRPLADGTASSLPQHLATKQDPFNFDLKQHEKHGFTESKSSAPLDLLSPSTPAPSGLKMKRPYDDPNERIYEGSQHHDCGPATPADKYSFSPSYVWGMTHMSTSTNPELTTASNALNASPAFSFHLPDQTPVYPSYTDGQLLHSSFYNDLPAFIDSNCRPLIPSTPLSAQSSEEKQGCSSSEPVPTVVSLPEQPLRKRTTKASQVNSSFETLAWSVATDWSCIRLVIRAAH